MPDTPIIQHVSGQQYIADTTVDNPQALTNSDANLSPAALSVDYVTSTVVYSDDGGRQDQPVQIHAG